MMKGFAFAVAVAFAMCANAMPTEAEIAKVRPVIDELTAGDRAAMKAGKKTPAQLAETLLGYVKDAESEAAKYVLITKAFDLYLESGDMDKARDAANRMLPANVRGCDLGPFNERLGYALAAKGLWEHASMAFGGCGGKLKEIVEWEKAYPATGVTELTTDAVGDFWWSKAEEHADNPKVAAALRAHAAKWLKEAIKNGSVRGLKKTLAERRIAEAEKGSVRPVETRPVEEKASDRAAAMPERKPFKPSKAPQPSPRRLRVGRVSIDFVGCPAGEFMMGCLKRGKDKPRSWHYYHRVKISRPFWLSKYKVTHEMWNAYQKVNLTKEDKVLGGMKRVHCVRADDADAFCEWLTKKCKAMLPPGYVVRLPTEAEWEYAFRANCSDPDNLYMKAIGLSRRSLTPDFAEIFVVWEKDVLPKIEKAGLVVEDRMCERIKGTEVGTKKPNLWGLYDMCGNIGERLLDRVDETKLKRENGTSVADGSGSRAAAWDDQDAINYVDGDIDPVNIVDEQKVQNISSLRRGGNEWGDWAGTFLKGPPCGLRNRTPFRLCIGPDLIKEKGYQKLKAGKR